MASNENKKSGKSRNKSKNRYKSKNKEINEKYKNNKRKKSKNKDINKKSKYDKSTNNELKDNDDLNKKPKHKKRKIRSIIVTIFKIFLIIILALILIIACMYLVELRKSNGNLTEAAFGMFKNVANTIMDVEDPIYVLLLGYSTDEGQTLTDTIILMGYNPSTQKAFMLSIPRDTYIGTNSKSATSYDKINALYSENDASEIIEAVEDITEIDIDYYVTINTEVLTEIVDVIGGVEFDVPIDMDYDDKPQNLHIHLEAGLQTLDGDEAEQLLRFRHNNDGTTYPSSYGDNDYGRMRTQREFIMALAEQCLEVNDLSTLKEIITTVFDSLETDCSLSVIFSYLAYIYDFDMDNLETATLPGESSRIPEETGLWFFVYDEDETEDLIDEMLEKFESEISNAELEESEEEDDDTNQVSNNTTNSTMSNVIYKNSSVNSSVNNSVN